MSLKVAVVTTSYPQSDDDPSGHFVRAEVDALVQQGHRVTVLRPGPTPTTRPDANPKVVGLGASSLFGWPGALVRVAGNPLTLVQLPPFLLKARRHLKSGVYDRIIAHWLVPCGWPIAGVSPVPTEVVVHGSDARLLAYLPTWLRERLLLSLVARGHRLRFVAAHLQTLLVTPRTASWIMTSEVSPSKLHIPPLPKREDARRLLGLDADGFVATVIGRLIPSKRVEVALKCTRLPLGARLYVIGSGPCEESLRQAFPQVVFLGQLARFEALLWLKASDVLLNASLLEGAPTVVREARALDVTVWTAPGEAVLRWAGNDPGICIRPELA